MANAFITVQLEARDALKGDLQLGQFIDELSAIKSALRHTERVVLHRDEHAVDYRVTGLSHSSPSQVTITMSSRQPAYKDVPRQISRRFSSSLRVVRNNHRYAERLDLRTLETFKAIAAPTAKHDLIVSVIANERRVQIDPAFDRSVSRLIAGDEQEYDELVGRVERIDIHNKNVFDIYPVVGPDRVRCSASRRLLTDVVSAIGKTVAVEGTALYRKDAPFPYAMRVEKINSRLLDSELPNMASMHGIAPNATGGMSAEDFVRKLRDEYW